MFVALFSLAVAGTWFYYIGTDEGLGEDGTFSAGVGDMKRTLTGTVRTLKTSIAGEYWDRASEGRIESGAVARSKSGCIISQAVANPSSKPISPIVLAFTFKAQDGSAIGKTINSSVDEALPPGASRRVRFNVACPPVFASAEVSPADKALSVGATAETAGTGISWPLRLGSNLPCAIGESCKVVIRFRTKESATYLLERRRFGGDRLRATDKRGGELLSVASDAALIVQQGRAGRLSIPIARDGDDRWSVNGAARVLADSSNLEAFGTGT